MDRAYFRGGKDLTPKPNELRIEPTTGLVLLSRGISLNSDPDQLARLGGAYRVVAIPDELEIVQHGRNKAHHELRPRVAMPQDRFFELLKHVELEDSPTA